MKTKDPKVRPTANQVLEQWNKIRPRISSLQRAWRVRPRGEQWHEGLMQEVASFGRWARSLVRRSPTRKSGGAAQ